MDVSLPRVAEQAVSAHSKSVRAEQELVDDKSLIRQSGRPITHCRRNENLVTFEGCEPLLEHTYFAKECGPAGGEYCATSGPNQLDR